MLMIKKVDFTYFDLRGTATFDQNLNQRVALIENNVNRVDVLESTASWLEFFFANDL